MKTKRPLTAAFKTKVVLEALKEQQTIASLAQKYEVHPNQITTWKKQFIDNAAQAFSSGKSKKEKSHQQTIEELYEQIGRLQVENSFLKKVL